MVSGIRVVVLEAVLNCYALYGVFKVLLLSVFFIQILDLTCLCFYSAMYIILNYPLILFRTSPLYLFCKYHIIFPGLMIQLSLQEEN